MTTTTVKPSHPPYIDRKENKMKRAVLVLSDYLVTSILKASLSTDRKITSVIKNALPDDVKIIRIGHDINGTLRIILESEEFEDIQDGKPYPILLAPHIKVETICIHNKHTDEYCLPCGRINNA